MIDFKFQMIKTTFNMWWLISNSFMSIDFVLHFYQHLCVANILMHNLNKSKTWKYKWNINGPRCRRGKWIFWKNSIERFCLFYVIMLFVSPFTCEKALLLMYFYKKDRLPYLIKCIMHNYQGRGVSFLMEKTGMVRKKKRGGSWEQSNFSFQENDAIPN